MAQVDSIKTRLDTIPKILKRFRQSVLAAAVSGKLTEDWRLQCGVEIQSSSDHWSKHNFGDLYQLIDGDRGPNYPKQSDYLLNGYCLFLSTKNVRPFGFLFEDPIYISENKHTQLRNGTLQVDDVVITTRGTLGNVAVYDSLIAKRYPLVRINSGMLIIREKISGTVFREYLKLFIASPHFADQLTAKQTGSAQPQIPAGILKTFSIGVPKLGEQQEIVRRVEQLFTYADQIEQRVKDAQARVNHLTQSILAKAFRGELTADWRAQNPDLISGENSAEALLAKIQAQRLKEKPKTGRKARA
jgi:type I restriction enzyme S subunit